MMRERRTTIGPERPSAALLAAAAAAKLAEIEAQVNEDEVLFVGPPPPAVVSEAESTNQAERFEEVTRIVGLEAGSTPYDVLAVNHKMTDANAKKKYWRLSLMIHPDKCSHPQASQAFVILSKAIKEFQDPNKRKALDDKIKLKEQEAAFKIELRSMREAAQWRNLQGISMHGDDVLLATACNTGVPLERDEWMTALPPERKQPCGMPKLSTKFSSSSKQGRGDTSNWTDTPSDRARKAKTNYVEAYNEARELASNKVEETTDAELVDKYNRAKRSRSLLEKTQEEAASKSKSQKKKKKRKAEKEEWTGQHPWKPWDREKDLTAGHKSIKLGLENMSQGGLTSRFSSANFQRSFL